jgi:hypothetical protein
MDKGDLHIYELFDGEHPYYSIHTLEMLHSNKDYLKSYYSQNIQNVDFKEIKSIQKHLDDYTLNPYLMLTGFESFTQENEIFEKLVDIIPALWENDYRVKERKIWRVSGEVPLNHYIKRLENPRRDFKFLEKMLNMVTSDNNQERFQDANKAERLFMQYSDEESIPLLMKKLKLISGLYNRFGHSPESIED